MGFIIDVSLVCAKTKRQVFLSGKSKKNCVLKARSLETYQAGLTKEAYIGFMGLALRDSWRNKGERKILQIKCKY